MLVYTGGFLLLLLSKLKQFTTQKSLKRAFFLNFFFLWICKIYGKDSCVSTVLRLLWAHPSLHIRTPLNISIFHSELVTCRVNLWMRNYTQQWLEEDKVGGGSWEL